MTSQFDINERMRAILIDWLIEVHYLHFHVHVYVASLIEMEFLLSVEVVLIKT